MAKLLSTQPLVEEGCFTHEGQTFCALGAIDHNDRLTAYITKGADGRRVMTSWDGSITFGVVIASSRFRSNFGRARIEHVRVRRPDGSIYAGRYGYDWSQCVNLKRMAK